jgi:hypothetical protein
MQVYKHNPMLTDLVGTRVVAQTQAHTRAECKPLLYHQSQIAKRNVASVGVSVVPLTVLIIANFDTSKHLLRVIHAMLVAHCSDCCDALILMLQAVNSKTREQLILSPLMLFQIINSRIQENPLCPVRSMGQLLIVNVCNALA